MAGKKKAKKKAAKKAPAKQTRRGRVPGSKNRPKAKQYAYAVVDSDTPALTLGLFADVDAARDAIAAQDALHFQLQTPVPPTVSDTDLDMMSEGIAPEVMPTDAPSVKPMTQFEWTIVMVRVTSADNVLTEW